MLQAIDSIFRTKVLGREQSQETEHWSERELQNLFVEIIGTGRSSPLAIVIDALDEGQEEGVQRLIVFFEELGWWTRPAAAPLQVCLTSRPYPNISIDKGLFITVELQLGHSTDIRSYIDQKLRLGHTKQMDKLRTEVVRKSAGVFLWVELVVRMLNQAYDQAKRPDEMIEVLERVLRTCTTSLPIFCTKVIEASTSVSPFCDGCCSRDKCWNRRNSTLPSCRHMHRR